MNLQGLFDDKGMSNYTYIFENEMFSQNQEHDLTVQSNTHYVMFLPLPMFYNFVLFQITVSLNV